MVVEEVGKDAAAPPGLNLYPRERLDFGKPLFRSHALATTVNDSVWHIMKQKHITCRTRETRAHLVIVARYDTLVYW